MFTFNFLPLTKLRSNVFNLIDEVDQAHDAAQTKAGEKRQNQLEQIKRVNNRSLVFVDDADLVELANIEHIAEYQKQILEYAKILKEMENEGKTRSLEYKQLEGKKKVYYNLINFLNKKANSTAKQITENEVSHQAAADSNKAADDTRYKYYNSNHMSLIITGLLLTIKDEIAFEYSGISNLMISLIKTNVPDNSELHKRIDKTIGITMDNQLDETSKINAKEAYQEFLKHPFVDILNKKLININDILLSEAKTKLKSCTTKECMSVLAKIRPATEDEIFKYKFYGNKIPMYVMKLEGTESIQDANKPLKECMPTNNTDGKDEIVLMPDLSLFATIKPEMQSGGSAVQKTRWCADEKKTFTRFF